MTDKGRILVIDDENIVRESCERILRPVGYDLSFAANGIEGLELLNQQTVNLILVDLKMPDVDGIGVLRKVRETWPHIDVILMTGYGTVATAVKAMKLGALDFIEKPFSPEDLLAVVSKASVRRRLSFPFQGEGGVASHYELANVVGVSTAMQRVFHLVANVSSTGSTVLITGESGTGKEIVARAIHFNSPRKDQPFVVADCTTIPDNLIESELFGHAKGAFTGASEKRKGLVELADGGTIFFDEIGNLDMSIQAKLLRLLQEREFRPLGDKRTLRVDIRIISATNKNLHTMIKDGTFREDLFYRLNIFPVHLPPLRERKDDIPHLAYHFLQKYNSELGMNISRITADAMKRLVCFDWPGNVRQLENTIQRAMIMCQTRTLRPEHFAGIMPSPVADVPATLWELKLKKKTLKNKSVEDLERAFLVEALKRNEWNVSRAATSVQMQRTNFHALMRKHNITKKADSPY